MKRISTNTKAADLFGAGKHGWRDGDLALGIQPTDAEAAWFNGLQEEIANVIEAASIALNGGSLNQLLTALRSAGVFQTAAQFDKTTKAATTEFVQAALGNDAGYVSVGTTSSLSAANAGKVHGISSGGITVTLPSVASLPPGAKFIIQGQQGSGSSASTISRAGSDTIFTDGTTALTTLSLAGGDTAVLEAIGTSTWMLVGGSASLRKANGDFGASMAVNGYQKLPSGLIVQWGTATVTGGTSLTVTLPIAFPTAIRAAFAQWSISAFNGGSTVKGSFGTGLASLSTISISPTDASGSFGVNWLAIGY